MRIPAFLVASIFSIVSLASSTQAHAADTIAEGQKVVDASFDLYWAKNREIRVIQKRRHLKEARWEGSVFTGIIPNDDFWLYYPHGASGTYFLTETVGIELNAAYVARQESDLRSFLQAEGLLSVELPQSLQWHSGVSGVWSPFHGKAGLFASKLFHFDFSLIFGLGAIGTIIEKLGESETTKVDIGGNLGAGFRVWLDKDIAMKLEYRHHFYPAEGGGVSFPVEFILAGSYFFGGVE